MLKHRGSTQAFCSPEMNFSFTTVKPGLYVPPDYSPRPIPCTYVFYQYLVFSNQTKTIMHSFALLTATCLYAWLPITLIGCKVMLTSCRTHNTSCHTTTQQKCITEFIKALREGSRSGRKR